MTATVAADYSPTTRIEVGGLGPTDLARLGEILAVLARHGVIVVARHGTTIAIRPRAQGRRGLAVALRRSFADLGPTFVKLGQLIASSPGLFPAELSEECRRLLDRVPPVGISHVRSTIARELGAPVEILFASFDDAPIAAASIAQVHAARLHDGREVAVKVRRPRLRRRIERDLRLLRVLATALERTGAVGRAINPLAVVDDFATTLRAELDLRLEAAAMRDFAATLKHSPDRDHVRIPAPANDLVSERVLVMDFIHGRPIDDVIGLDQGHDLGTALQVAVRVWLEGVVVHGFFHGDVHAGNLFVTTDGRVAFLDFGITGRIAPAIRDVLRDVLPAIILDHDFERVVDALFDIGAASGPIDRVKAAADLDALVTPLLSRAIGDIIFGELLDQVMHVATRHRVRLPRELVLVVKQLLYFERYAKAIAPDRQILADPALLALLRPAI